MTTWREARGRLHAANPRLKDEYNRLELAHALQVLNGLPCWEVIAGRGTGSNFTMHLGKKRLRSMLLTNRTISAMARRYRGEFVLYVQGPWRVNAGRRRLATWTDAIDRLDLMLAGLRSMKGAHVTKIRLRRGELRVGFDNGTTLVVFPDEPDYAANRLFDFSTPGNFWCSYSSGVIKGQQTRPPATT